MVVRLLQRPSTSQQEVWRRPLDQSRMDGHSMYRRNERSTGGTMIVRIVVMSLLAIVAAACQPRAVPVLATADYEQLVRTITTPAPDRTRLYIFLGKMPTGAIFTPYTVHSISGDIYIDEVKIGSLNPKEAMVIDLIPGKHKIHWHYLDQSGGPLLKSQRFESDFEGGTTQVLFANSGWFDLEIAPGIVVTKNNPGPTNNVIPPMFKIVRAGSCPPSICLTSQ